MYSKEAINRLTRFIKGDKEAGKWLVDNNLKELELLYYALKGYEGAFKELKGKKYYEVTAFVDAVQGSASSFNWLVKNKKYEWAATVSVIKKKKDAAMWLIHYKFEHYIDLAQAIQNELIIENEGDFMGIIRSWIKMLLRGPFKK